jgi:hypothetical protein
LLPAGRIDPTGRQERDVQACRLGGSVAADAMKQYVDRMI